MQTRNIVLLTEFDGTGYCGWQSQKNGDTIQKQLTDAILKLTGESTALVGCSRTDAGVHAFRHFSNFITGCSIPVEKIPYAINSYLPDGIVVKKAFETDAGFHSRYAAIGKHYRYIIRNSRFPSAFSKSKSWHIKPLLDIQAMRKAASYFEGTHDFKAFMASGSTVKNTRRTIFSAILSQSSEFVSTPFKSYGFENIIAEGINPGYICKDTTGIFEILENDSACEIYFDIKGNGFLYNMVRIMTGTLVYTGLGKIEADRLPGIIEGKDRKMAGITAPAHGLYLMNVYYHKKHFNTD